MTDGIGRLSGYGNYGVGGYMPQRKKEELPQGAEAQQQQVQQNYQETQVDPAKVMDFLSKNNFFVAESAPKEVDDVSQIDAATQDRVAGYMEQFEMIYGIVQEEFGEELAPAVMDIVMDKLMGMAE